MSTAVKDLYIVEKSPLDSKFYVLSFVGRNRRTGKRQFMPISDPFESRKAALAWIPHMRRALAAAKAELAI